MNWLVASVDGLVDLLTLARREWIPTPARGNQKKRLFVLPTGSI
jgi:hypothetical protein